MFSKDLQIVDIEPNHIQNVYDFILRGSDVRKKNIIMIIYRGNKILTAIHFEKGPLYDLPFTSPDRLEEIAKTVPSELVICIENRVLRTIMSNFQIALNLHDDFIKQFSCLLRNIREFVGRGVYLYPKNFQYIFELPIDKFVEFSRFIFYLIRNFIFAFVVFDGDDIWTSLIICVRNKEISLITTTDHLQLNESLSREEKIKEIMTTLKRYYKRRPYTLILDKALFNFIISSRNSFKTLLSTRKMFLKFHLPSCLYLIFFLFSLI